MHELDAGDGPLNAALNELARDLLAEEGPRLGGMRDSKVAVVPYHPARELALRRAIERLSQIVESAGRMAVTLSLHALFLTRIRASVGEQLDAIVSREKHLTKSIEPSRGLRMLKERIAPIVEGPNGLAADVSREIDDRLREVRGGVIFLGRAGALYPFLRPSTLLKHVVNERENVTIVLLYPGMLVGDTGLSFMGVIHEDRDYRIRVYP